MKYILHECVIRTVSAAAFTAQYRVRIKGAMVYHIVTLSCVINPQCRYVLPHHNTYDCDDIILDVPCGYAHHDVYVVKYHLSNDKQVSMPSFCETFEGIGTNLYLVPILYCRY